jgi:uncharacterized membrane protein (UPF0127 family)
MAFTKAGTSLPFSFVARAALILAATPARAQSPQSLPTVKLTAGMYAIQAEVASDMGTRMVGLMHRASMPANAGMLFIFDESTVQCMWMKNTLIPLSVAFLDEAGAIINVEDMKPQTEESHCAKRPARYALEMNRGWFASRGIKPGMRLGGIPGR